MGEVDSSFWESGVSLTGDAEGTLDVGRTIRPEFDTGSESAILLDGRLYA